MKTNIILQRSVVQNPDISPDGIAVYISLRRTCIKSITTRYVTPTLLYYDLVGNDIISQNTQQKIISGINNLSDIGLLRILKAEKPHYIIDTSNLIFDSNEEGFLTIDCDEIYRVAEADKDNFKLLKYLVIMLSTLSSKTTVCANSKIVKNVIGNCTIEKLCLLSGVNERTAHKYNKILEDNKIIYIYRFASRSVKTNKYPTNIYGRFCNKLHINMYISSTLNYLPTDEIIDAKKTINHGRSMIQKYNYMLLGKEYPLEVVIDIHNFINSRNEKYQNLYESSGDETYLSKIRDTNIFDKYDFLPENWEDELFD